MSISIIERDRAILGISQKELCAAAEVHETTYSALKRRRRGGNVATLEKLRTALDALVAERNAGGPPAAGA